MESRIRRILQKRNSFDCFRYSSTLKCISFPGRPKKGLQKPRTHVAVIQLKLFGFYCVTISNHRNYQMKIAQKTISDFFQLVLIGFLYPSWVWKKMKEEIVSLLIFIPHEMVSLFSILESKTILLLVFFCWNPTASQGFQPIQWIYFTWSRNAQELRWLCRMCDQHTHNSCTDFYYSLNKKT